MKYLSSVYKRHAHPFFPYSHAKLEDHTYYTIEKIVIIWNKTILKMSCVKTWQKFFQHVYMFRICQYIIVMLIFSFFFYNQKSLSQSQTWWFELITGSQTMPIWQKICSDYMEGMHEELKHFLHPFRFCYKKIIVFFSKLTFLYFKSILFIIQMTTYGQFCLPKIHKD